jgi:hypothetical protein
MKSRFFSLRLILLPAVLIAAINLTNAQSKEDSLAQQNLYREIDHMDSVLFNAFNTYLGKILNTLFTVKEVPNQGVNW